MLLRYICRVRDLMVRNKSKKNKRKKTKKNRPGSSKRKKLLPKRKVFVKKEEEPGGLALPLITFLIIGLILGSVVYFFVIKKKNNDIEQIKANTMEVLGDKIETFTLKYPLGFNVVTIFNNKSLPSEYDTLPVGLDVPWKKIRLLRASPEELKDNPGLTKIKIPGINYAPKNISETDVIIQFIRRPGIINPVIGLGDKRLFMEVIEAYENSMICLFGVR